MSSTGIGMLTHSNNKLHFITVLSLVVINMRYNSTDSSICRRSLMESKTLYTNSNGELSKHFIKRYAFGIVIDHVPKKYDHTAPEECAFEIQKYHSNSIQNVKPEAIYETYVETTYQQRIYRTEKVINFKPKTIAKTKSPVPPIFLSDVSTQTENDQIDTGRIIDSEPDAHALYLERMKFYENTYDFWVEKKVVTKCFKSHTVYAKEVYKYIPFDSKFAVKRNMTKNENISLITHENCLQGRDYVIAGNDLVPCGYIWMVDRNNEFVKVNINKMQPIDLTWKKGTQIIGKGRKSYEIKYEWVYLGNKTWIKIDSSTGRSIGKSTS